MDQQEYPTKVKVFVFIIQHIISIIKVLEDMIISVRKFTHTISKEQRYIYETSDKYCPNGWRIYYSEIPKSVENQEMLDKMIKDVKSRIDPLKDVDYRYIITALSIPFVGIKKDMFKMNGIIFISPKACKNCIEKFSIKDKKKFFRDIVKHECRHAEQFEYLRSIGGDDLIMKMINDVINKLHYLDNPFEIDAYRVQNEDIYVPLEEVFKDYI